MTSPRHIIVVGAGIMGVTSALALRRRGDAVTLLDAGAIPHPDASSTDISKMIRADYGTDTLYTELMLEALEGWRRWNTELDDALFHEEGFLILKRGALAPGDFEYESRAALEGMLPLEAVDAEARRRRFPLWSGEVDQGYFNPNAGWAESGRVVAALAARCGEEGVVLRPHSPFGALVTRDGHVVGVRLTDGESIAADAVVVAAGAWTPALLPWLSEVMWSVAQPVVHFAPPDPAAYRPPHFPCWAADISRTGWYGFCANAEGLVKVANHGDGVLRAPGPGVVDDATLAIFRTFLSETFPSLSDAPVVATRLCHYCDTWDGNFWIDHDPERPGLLVATGGSGHAFKFAPVLGELVADALHCEMPSTRARRDALARFAWRARQSRTLVEDARFRREPGA